MTTFQFPQRVMTPKGEATFIGYMTGGARAQVSRVASVKEFTRDECEARKPSVADMTAGEYEVWRTNAHITVNEIYPASDLALASDQSARALKFKKRQADLPTTEKAM